MTGTRVGFVKRNGQLALALHTLSHMAAERERVRTSADIAEHAGTNPVVVRRVLGKLREAGLLVSEKGHAGGWRLSLAPEEITIADVYLALGEHLVATKPGHRDQSDCSIESAMHDRIDHVMAEIEDTLVARLRETSIAELREDTVL